MILLFPEIRLVLLANGRARRAAEQDGSLACDLLPVVKFFSPMGAALPGGAPLPAGLASELDDDDDDDTLFGLGDLGSAALNRAISALARSKRSGFRAGSASSVTAISRRALRRRPMPTRRGSLAISPRRKPCLPPQCGRVP